MVRVSREEKAQTHDRIVRVAARLFREKGIEATGVADVMKAAGLTHGGFYRHFASKGALVTAAISQAVATSLEDLRSADGKEARTMSLLRYIDMYLSDDHVGDPGNGCPLAALGGEAPHAPGQIANALGAGSNQAISALAAAMEGRRAAASALMATLLGTVVLARMATTHRERHRILSAGRVAALNCVNGHVW
jgi:TetR/AcrR family transcriptional repressor of nem operon